MKATISTPHRPKAIIAPVHRIMIPGVLIITLMLVIGAGIARGEVKTVQMKIAGYLCGN